MKQAQADVQYVEAVKQFDQGNFEGFLEQFFLAIHSRYDIEKPVIKRFIRKKLEIINRQKKENQRLREQLYVQRKNLEKYAREYYLMGNECITQAHDSRAAIMIKPSNSIRLIQMHGFEKESLYTIIKNTTRQKYA